MPEVRSEGRNNEHHKANANRGSAMRVCLSTDQFYRVSFISLGTPHTTDIQAYKQADSPYWIWLPRRLFPSLQYQRFLAIVAFFIIEGRFSKIPP